MAKEKKTQFLHLDNKELQVKKNWPRKEGKKGEEEKKTILRALIYLSRIVPFDAWLCNICLSN